MYQASFCSAGQAKYSGPTTISNASTISQPYYTGSVRFTSNRLHLIKPRFARRSQVKNPPINFIVGRNDATHW
jgi:hypothetical protein